MNKIQKVQKGHYQLDNLTILFLQRMSIGLWFVYDQENLTRNVWTDATPKTFVSYKEAKEYALGAI
jgi:hypothetical protein